MSEVKRYDMRVSLGGVESYESPCGDYVDYEDYAELEAKCSDLAAENAWLKSKGREVLNEACKVYDKFNANIDSDFGDFMDGQTLHEFQFLLDVETTATDAFLAEVRAQGVEMFGQYHNFSEKLFIQKEAQKFAAHLRKGVDKK